RARRAGRAVSRSPSPRARSVTTCMLVSCSGGRPSPTRAPRERRMGGRYPAGGSPAERSGPVKRHDRRRVVRRGEGGQVGGRDDRAVEEPLEIRVDGQAVSVTMRPPGDDFELALGYCLTERIVAADDVAGIWYCTTDAPGPCQGDFNVVDLGTRS